jgi:hypothetical protein
MLTGSQHKLLAGLAHHCTPAMRHTQLCAIQTFSTAKNKQPNAASLIQVMHDKPHSPCWQRVQPTLCTAGCHNNAQLPAHTSPSSHSYALLFTICSHAAVDNVFCLSSAAALAQHHCCSQNICCPNTRSMPAAVCCHGQAIRHAHVLTYIMGVRRRAHHACYATHWLRLASAAAVFRGRWALRKWAVRVQCCSLLLLRLLLDDAFTLQRHKQARESADCKVGSVP